MFYRLFDFMVNSDIGLPELVEAADAETVDFPDVVRLSFCPADQRSILDQSFARAPSRDRIVIQIEKIARYDIAHGSRLEVIPDRDAIESDVRAYLFGLALPILAYQRHLLPLHISAVATGRGAVAFTGESGAGKSTLATWLALNRGLLLLSDDVACVQLNDQHNSLLSGIKAFRLWNVELQKLKVEPSGSHKYFGKEDKYQLYDQRLFDVSTKPLVSIVGLEWGNKLSLVEVSGANKIGHIARTIFRSEFSSIISSVRLAEKMLQMSKTIECYTFTRPKSATPEDQHRVLARLL